MRSTLPKPKYRTAIIHKRYYPRIQTPQYKVILLKDNINLSPVTIDNISTIITDMSQDEAKTKVLQAHENGSSILRICDQYLAEEYCEELRNYSIKSIIEPFT